MDDLLTETRGNFLTYRIRINTCTLNYSQESILSYTISQITLCRQPCVMQLPLCTSRVVQSNETINKNNAILYIIKIRSAVCEGRNRTNPPTAIISSVLTEEDIDFILYIQRKSRQFKLFITED